MQLALSILDKAAKSACCGAVQVRVVLAVTPMAGAVALPRVLRITKNCVRTPGAPDRGLLGDQVLPT